jgi:hypothetical protein
MSAPEQVIALGVVEAEELAELLEFASEFLSIDDERLRLAYRSWARGGGREYSIGELLEDLERTASQIRCTPVVAR